MPLDFVADLTRFGRLLRRGLEGEDIVSEVAEEAISKERARYAGKVEASQSRQAKKEKPKCRKTPGCILGYNHESGSCVLNAEVIDE